MHLAAVPLQITLTPQGIITTFGVLTALIGIIALLAKAVRWMDRQKQQDGEIQALRDTHNADMDGVKQEQRLIVYGLLACLKGLSEQGCDGPVTEAISTIENHLNKQAHK